jgi:hypothetical protein
MPKMQMRIPHNLSQEEAVARVQKLLSEVKNDFGDKVSHVAEEWNGPRGSFAFSAMGFSVSGTVTVNPSDVEISGTLPLAAAFFRRRIETVIEERAKTLLA